MDIRKLEFIFESLNIHVNHNGLPSDNKPEFRASLSINPIKDKTSNKEFHFSFYLINEGNLILTLKVEGASLTTTLIPYDRIWQSNHSITFYKKIDNFEIKYLNKWRKGKSILIDYNITGYGILSYTNEYALDKIIQIKAWKSGFKLTTDEFQRDFLKLTNRYENLLYEFSIVEPNIESQRIQSTTIHQLLIYLNIMQSGLRQALNTYRQAQSEEEFAYIMIDIRVTLDSLLKFITDSNNKENLANDLYINSGQIKDINPSKSGRKIATENIVNDLINYIKIIHDITSKNFHTTTRPSSGSLDYIMKLYKDEVDFVLIMGLNFTTYLYRKIEQCLKTI